MTTASYIENRSAYHWSLGLFLAAFGGFGYVLITELTRQAEAGNAQIVLSYAHFTLPIALLLAVIPLLLEVLHRGNLKHLSESGFMAVLVLIPLLLYGWMDFSKTRFEGWLGGLGYERCASMDVSSGLLPHEVWVQAGSCVVAE